MAACEDCERPYGDEHGFPDLVVPHEVWERISPTRDSGGLLCPSCICRRAHDAGIANVSAAFRSGPFVNSRAEQLEAAIVAIIDAHDARDVKAMESALMVGRGLTF